MLKVDCNFLGTICRGKQIFANTIAKKILPYTVRIKIKKVIHIQRPIVLKSIDLNICIRPICKRTTHPLSIGTILASCMSRMTEYIAIEDDNVISHFLQVWVIGIGRLQWMQSLVIQMDECLVIKQDALKVAFKSLGDHCKLSKFALEMIGRIIFLPWSFHAPTSSTYPPLISMQIWQRWSMSWMSCLTIAR